LIFTRIYGVHFCIIHLERLINYTEFGITFYRSGDKFLGRGQPVEEDVVFIGLYGYFGQSSLALARIE
jgi:hypothetical protein